MKRSFFTLAILLFAVTFSTAQFRLGPKAGFTLARISNLEQTSDWGNRFHGGIQIGLVANSGEGTLRFQPELLYWQTAGKLMEDNSNYFIRRWNYLQLPLLANINFGEGTRFFINVGPYLAYALSGNVESEILGVEVEDDYEFDDDVEDDGFADRRLDIGGIVGLGVAFDAGPGSLQLEARYNMGFMDLARYDGDRPDDVDPMKNMVFGFSLAYLFEL